MSVLATVSTSGQLLLLARCSCTRSRGSKINIENIANIGCLHVGVSEHRVLNCSLLWTQKNGELRI